MSRKEREVVSSERAKLGEFLGWTSLSLGYGWICPHNKIIIWSDEPRCCFYTPESCLRRSGVKLLPKCRKTTDKHENGGIMVRRISSFEVDEQIRREKYISAKKYINILEKGLLPTTDKFFSSVNRAGIIFQHDNAHPHSAKLTKNVLTWTKSTFKSNWKYLVYHQTKSVRYVFEWKYLVRFN